MEHEKKPFNHDEFIETVKQYVAKWTNDHMDKSDAHRKEITPEDVYVVWSCKTLQNSKGLFSTPNTDGMYFEATLNGDKNEIYFDAYKKFDNVVLTQS